MAISMEKLKSVIRNSELYKKLRFWVNTPPKDFFDAKKLFLFKKVYPFTMASYQRLSNVYELAREVEKNKLPGVFAECGVWKGGTSAVMAFVSEEYKSGRKIWLFDSFEGLPEPTEKDGAIAKDYAGNRAEGKMEPIDKCVGHLAEVKKIFFEILKINPENVVFEKGWFQDTLPVFKGDIGPIVILRLDGDWYESTKVCLDNLYDNVIAGGYVIIDDYGHWEGARKALDEFFEKRNIKPELITIDYTGRYFRK